MRDPRIAIVSTVRSPGNAFETWIDYHRRMVDKIYLYLDDPGNEDEELIPEDRVVRRFSGNQKSTMSGPNGVMQRQIANVENALMQCVADEIDWLFHIDADELIYGAQTNLRTYLKDLDSDIGGISFVNHEVVATVHTDDCFKDLHLFKKNGFKRDAASGAHDQKIHGFLFYGNGKSAVRVDACERPDGVHAFSLNKGKLIKEDAICILHYPCPTYQDWLKKYSQLGDFMPFWWDDPNSPITFSFHTGSRDAYLRAFHSGDWTLAFNYYLDNLITQLEQDFMMRIGALFFADPLAGISLE